MSDDFPNIVQGPTKAGATLQEIWSIGQFRGVIRAHTPMLSCTIRVARRLYSQAISPAALIVA